MRAVRDSDAKGLVDLVGGCFAEYEGVYLDTEDLDSDLLAYESAMKAQNGEGYVLLRGDDLVASVALAPVGADKVELKRLYLSESLRGTGLGLYLLQYIEDRAKARGAKLVLAWSDSRFERAHRFYEREGYERQAETRDLMDISDTTEYLFEKVIA